MMQRDRVLDRLPLMAVIAAMGFFALVAQTLLFREFFAVYEGNELGVGCFFGSWLVWVALGAWVGRGAVRHCPSLTRDFAWWPLVYLPATILQLYLIARSRVLAGVAAYELFPFVNMLPVSLAANAPVSLITGFLFTLACRRTAGVGALPAAQVYVLESLGSVAGGVMTTLLLAQRVAGETILLAAALPLLAAGGWAQSRRGHRLAHGALMALPLALLAVRADLDWAHYNGQRLWSRLLPAAAYQGRFSTPQARYLYGEANGQFNVIAHETLCESVPDVEHASEIAAIHLAQRPDARRVLVIGPGAVALCGRLLRVPQIEAVTWLHPDPDYPPQLLRRLPPALTQGLDRLDVPAGDARRYLRTSGAAFDLVILNLPDPTTLTMNRYFNREFFALVKTRLMPGGVLGVRVSGGENFLGDELSDLGASVQATLGSVFSRLALKAGDESWLLASDADTVSEAPAVLRERWQAIPGAAALYPPAGLLSLFLPDRIAFQRRAYRRALETAPPDALLNTDARPKAGLYSLLLIGKQAGAGGTWRAASRLLGEIGWPALWLSFAVAGLLRWLYRLRRPEGAILCVGESESEPRAASAATAGPAAPPSSGDGLTPGRSELCALPSDRGEGTPAPAGRDVESRSPRAAIGGPSVAALAERGPPIVVSAADMPDAAHWRARLYDTHGLVASTGFVGLALSLVLMYAYQARFGSLFLHMGALSALFMLGLFGGSGLTALGLARHLPGGPRGRAGCATGPGDRAPGLQREQDCWCSPGALSPGPNRHRSRTVTDPLHGALPLIGLLLGHGLLLLAVARLPVETTPIRIAALFFPAGLLNGAYVSLAARRLQAAGLADDHAGAWIEWGDHIGGALGAFATGLVLLPVLGVGGTLGVLAGVLALNLAGAPRMRSRRAAVPPWDRADRWLRPAAYAGVGTAAVGLIWLWCARAVEVRHGEDALLAAGRAMAPALTAHQVTTSLPDGGRLVVYFELAPPTGTMASVVAAPLRGALRTEDPAYPDGSGTGNAGAITGFSAAAPGATRTVLFDTDAWAGAIHGYGGPMTLAVWLDRNGTLLDFKIVRARETPSYWRLLDPWWTRLKGRNVFAAEPFAGIDAVTGATLSSRAVKQALVAAGHGFGTQVLHLDLAAARVSDAGHGADVGGALEWALLAAIAAGLRYRPSLWGRRAFLVLVLLAAGLHLNAQYSIAQWNALWVGQWPRVEGSIPFLLIVGVPLLVLLLGNFYCGYLCPFGAAQELAGTWAPARLAPRKRMWRYGRQVKYGLLWLAVLTVVWGAGEAAQAVDPLVTIFGPARTRGAVWLAGLALALSCVWGRFWCRNLCPVGAALALLGGARLWRTPWPPVNPAHCVYGVRHGGEWDCLQCDRCRLAPAAGPDDTASAARSGWNRREWAYAAAVALLAAAVVWQGGVAFARVRGTAAAARALGSGGRPRPVDVARMRALLQQRSLSDHEAKYYQPVP